MEAVPEEKMEASLALPDWIFIFFWKEENYLAKILPRVNQLCHLFPLKLWRTKQKLAETSVNIEVMRVISGPNVYYSIRTLKEKVVGNMNLKPMANRKTQLSVWVDTSLGKVLLNLLFHPVMLCTAGKNNILIVCIPVLPVEEKNATIPSS
ncbi:Nuclear pore complex protein Nup50, partial [Galemys pyrenaicus]